MQSLCRSPPRPWQAIGAGGTRLERRRVDGLLDAIPAAIVGSAEMRPPPGREFAALNPSANHHSVMGGGRKSRFLG